MRAFVYLRQSLDRAGSGAAVARQREDCFKLCVDRGWEVVRVFDENDTSASSTRPRPQYLAMLAAIERGEADVIVAWHVDRLTRKLTELEGLIELAERTGLRITTVTGDVDLSTDAGRLVGRILASVARGEVERKGARQRRAQQQAAHQGRPAGGRRAFGYTSDGMRLVDDEAAAVREAHTALLAGASLKSIARRWNEAGLLTTMGNAWTHSTVRETLRNPRYAGKRTYQGEVVGPAMWPALVDDETHDAAVALLAAPGRRTTTTTSRKYLLPSLAHCWKCGSDVATGHTRHGKRVYTCRANKCISRAAEPVDAYVADAVVERLSRPEAAASISRDGHDKLAADHAQARILRERLDDLAVGLEEGLLSLKAVRSSSDRLRAELAVVESRLNAAIQADVLAQIAQTDDPASAWDRADLQRRRAIIEALKMSITLLPPRRGRQQFDPATVLIEFKHP